MPDKKTYYVITCTILMCLYNTSFAQTTSIYGEINDYYKVLGIDRDNSTVTLNKAYIFNELPDTVLLIQMTGIAGNEVDKAGLYEFHIVTQVNGSTITLQAPPGSFKTNELVQLIRVPSYKNAQIDEKLTCKEWNWADGTGGVLALMVEGTLSLNADIDVSERGFKGGKAYKTVYSGPCSFNASDGTNLPDYPDASDLAGYKGEGAVTINIFNPDYLTSSLKGYRPTWNGGGGGNGKWSGGGGGANGRAGGTGDNQACGVPGFDLYSIPAELNAGNAIRYNNLFDNGVLVSPSERAYMGGGGGAGTGTGTAGGNGGGIVIIVAQKLQFNTNIITGVANAIKANGGSVEGILNDAGAGGGGAGGSILLSVEDYGDFHAQIKGGNGGSVNRITCNNVENSMGAGGGGSGGFIIIKGERNLLNDWIANNQVELNGGSFGRNNVVGVSCDGNVTGGGAGYYLPNNSYPLSSYHVQTRGFLNNYLIAPSDSVCYGESVTIRASQPIGVAENYNDYDWLFLSDDGKWIPVPAHTISTVSLTELKCMFDKDTYIRRVVSAGITDSSSRIKILVRSAIENNDIYPDETTLCGNVQKFDIEGNIPKKGGGGPYTYEWEESYNNGVTWSKVNDATGTGLSVSLQNSGGKQLYRRKAISYPGCVSSWSTTAITVQPAIRNEITPAGLREICGDTAGPLTGPELTGGNGIYNCRWEMNTDENNSKNWQEISTQQIYQPKLGLLNYGEYFYRRIVTSGECTDTGNVVKIRFDRQPLLSEFEIMANDETGDLVGDKALKFQFNASLQVIQPPDAGSGTWTWSSPNDMPKVKPVIIDVNIPKTMVNQLNFGMNTLTWEATNGVCLPVSVSVNIEVKDVIIYNGLSPNNDSKNDCFMVEGGENAGSSELIIFDRYNNVVFKSSMSGIELRNCSCWWDGRSSSGKELPSGTYFYHLILGKEKEKKGYVVLKRQ